MPEPRNLVMAERIAAAPARYPLRFVVAGDSGAWPDPTADAIFGALLEQTAALDPPPVFFANLGDFAGPGTPERHEHYLRLVERLDLPNICVIGNHDLDDLGGPDAWERYHGPRTFEFAHGHTRFVVLDAAPGEVGELAVSGPDGMTGPRDAALAFLDRALAAAGEPHRVVLLHAPPYLDGHFAPHAEWGFTYREADFLDILRRHGVALVCCAHGLAFDHHERDGIHFVMSGGGGSGLCSHRRGICAEGDGRPEDRGAVFHAVELSLAEDGAVSGRVLQAFGGERFHFGAAIA